MRRFLENRPERLLAAYRNAPRKLSEDFIRSLDIGSMGSLTDDERFVLTYMRDIEDAVDWSYFPELAAAPTARNPFVSSFLVTWKEEEAVHARVLAQALEASGGPVPGIVMTPAAGPTLIPRLLGEDLFAGIHMAIGAINEAQTRFAYSCLARMTRNPTLRTLLKAIAAEGSLHFAFYRGMADHYLGRSFLARKIAVAAASKYWLGVGINVRTATDARRVMRHVFRGTAEHYRRAVGNPIRTIPGFERFYRPELLLDTALA